MSSSIKGGKGYFNAENAEEGLNSMGNNVTAKSIECYFTQRHRGRL